MLHKYSQVQIKDLWGWGVGAFVGVMYYLKNIQMKTILNFEWALLWQYGQALLVAFGTGAAGAAGKWLIDVIRNKKKPKT